MTMVFGLHGNVSLHCTRDRGLPSAFDSDYFENAESDASMQIGTLDGYSEHETSHDQHVSVLQREDGLSAPRFSYIQVLEHVFHSHVLEYKYDNTDITLI